MTPLVCALFDPKSSPGDGALKSGSAKTDPVQFKWGFGEGLLKDKSALFEAYKNPIPKRRKLLAKRPFFFKAKGPCLKNPFKLDRVSFSTPDFDSPAIRKRRLRKAGIDPRQQHSSKECQRKSNMHRCEGHHFASPFICGFI